MKKAILTALIAAMTLCSCGTVKYDVEEDYKAYLMYAFDGKYSVSDVTEIETDDDTDTIIRTWQVNYTDVNSEEQSGNIIVITEKGMDKESVKAEYDKAVLSFVWFERSKIVEAEMAELLSEHFDINDGESTWVLEGDDFSVYLEYSDCEMINADNETYAKRVTHGSGYKYTGVSLKEWAVDRKNVLEVSVVLNDSSRTEEFMQRFAEFDEAFIERTESPKNYCFTLDTYNEHGEQITVASDCRMLGEESGVDSFNTETVAGRLGMDTRIDAEG